MSGEASNAIQAAVYSALSNDPALTVIVGAGGVHDWAGPGANFPCVSIGDDTAKDFDTCTSDGQETTVTIHTWSQSQGRYEVKSLMSNVYRILHKSNLTISGQTLVLMRCEFSQTFLDPDGITFHGVQRFRTITQGV